MFVETKNGERTELRPNETELITKWSAKPVGVRVAWISGAFVLLAAIITGLFTWCSPKPQGATSTISANQNQGPVTLAGAARDITINYNVPATETKEAIAALEEKLKSTSATVELTRNEVKLLAHALTDLDQRTSAIKKLPDGRTLMRGWVGGEPTITLQEHDAAVQAFQKKEFTTALEHSKKAVGSYEETKKVQVAASTGDLTSDSVGKMYFLAAALAGNANELDTALNWIKKAGAANPLPEYKAFEVTVLYDLGKKEEARTLLDDALKASPDNAPLLDAKKRTGL